jgi:hypothetical protein
MGPSPKDDAAPQNAFIDRVLKARTPRETEAAYRRLFREFGHAHAAELLHHDDLGIALHSAWQTGVAGKGRGDAAPQRFLGFLEGRTRLRVPLRWEVGFVSRWFASRPFLHRAALNPYLPVAKFLKADADSIGGFVTEPEPLRPTGMDLKAVRGTSLTRRGADATIAVRGEHASVRLNHRVVEKLREHYHLEAVAAAIGPRHSLLAFYDLLGTRFPLLCVDTKSGRVEWQAEVWALNFEAGSTAPIHRLSMAVGDKAVGVFGEGGRCYLEIFDLTTGAPACRFCTDYWGYRE